MRCTLPHRIKSGIRGENVFKLKTNVSSKIGSGYMFDAEGASRSDLVTLGKAEALLRRERARNEGDDDAAAYKPSLKRSWARAPPSVLSTAASRRDWFRFMCFNWMVDTVTPYSAQAAMKAQPDKPAPANNSAAQTAAPNDGDDVGQPSSPVEAVPLGAEGQQTTTPVLNVSARIPAFARPQHNASSAAAGGGFVTYDPSIDPTPPPFLQPTFRRNYLVNEVRHYDPDLLCLNEVNRTHFNDGLWKYLRSLGYGGIYTSSRGYQVKALRRGDDAKAPKHAAKIPEAEDIGNAIFFHKARFVPNLMPGELPNHLHYAQFCTLKDKVTNMTVLLANVQLTLGDTHEGMCIRAHEARMVLKVLEAVKRNDVDRGHTTMLVCGDLNNTHDEEECVQVFRDKLFSAYDLVGGPRWTTWCKASDSTAGSSSAAGGAQPNKYYADNKRGWETSNTTAVREKAMVEAMRRREADREMAKSIAAAAARAQNDTGGSGGGEQPRHQVVKRRVERKVANPEFPWITETKVVEEEVPVEQVMSPAAAARLDEVAERKAVMLSQGILQRTQDFVFYDPNTLAVHQVLDAPDDAEIDPMQLLPCSKHPSHHIPLLVDVSFNDIAPDMALTSTKP